MNEIVNYDGDDFSEFFERISLLNVFKDLIEQNKHDKGLLKQLITYIVWTYSVHSNRVVNGLSWLENKKSIFEQTMLPLEKYDSVVLLRDEVVVTTIKRYLDVQDSDVATELKQLKDLRCYMQSTYVMPGIDDEQRMKNAKHSMELKSMIAELEKELIQNSELKVGHKEVQKFRRSNTIGPETFAKTS